jgi:hypothetical protein
MFQCNRTACAHIFLPALRKIKRVKLEIISVIQGQLYSTLIISLLFYEMRSYSCMKPSSCLQTLRYTESYDRKKLIAIHANYHKAQRGANSFT